MHLSCGGRVGLKYDFGKFWETKESREGENCAAFNLNAPFMRIRLDIVKSYGGCEEDIAKIYMRNGMVLCKLV